MRFTQIIRPCLLTALLIGVAHAQPTTAPSDNLLGKRYESLASGIALRPPAGARVVRGALGSPDVVNFVVDDRRWTIKLTRILQDKPLPLTLWKDPVGVERAGVLEWTVEQFKLERPGAQVLRDETTVINHNQVGLMAAKYSFGTETYLLQQALIRGSDLQYFMLSLTCPAPKSEDLTTDPNAQAASDTFMAMLDSAELLDQAGIHKDQEERLYRTRELLTTIKSEDKVRKILVPRQFLRYLHDGKDVGYSYVEEDVAHDLPVKGMPDIQTGPAGVRVGVRSRMIPEPGGVGDGESWLFSTFDFKAENFNSISYAQDPKGVRTTAGEVGTSRWREKPVLENDQKIGSQRGISLTQEYRLEVTKIARNVSNEPIVRDLPPFYLPQAYGQILPRLVASRGTKTYLFAVWVSDASQVMYRYVDVESEREASLPGRRFRAIPIKDRIGLEGSTTTHYVTPDGVYMGSVNEDSKLTILSSDEQSIQRIWRNADLTRPDATDHR